jgi:hypothetical protein
MLQIPTGCVAGNLLVTVNDIMPGGAIRLGPGDLVSAFLPVTLADHSQSTPATALSCTVYVPLGAAENSSWQCSDSAHQVALKAGDLIDLTLGSFGSSSNADAFTSANLYVSYTCSQPSTSQTLSTPGGTA